MKEEIEREGVGSVDDDDLDDTIVNFEGRRNEKKSVEWANIHDKILPRGLMSQQDKR